MLKVGCSGFPVGRARYFAELGAVELDETFEKLPRLSTAEKMRAEAPKGFVYSMKAWQAVTHTCESPRFQAITETIPLRRRDAYGHFRASPEVSLAWEATRGFANALGATFVVFETPASFFPDANHLRDMYRFFKEIRRDKLTLVWQPRGKWGDELVERVCRDLSLVPAYDPLARATKAPRTRVNYFRLPGAAHTEAALKALRSLCESAPSYVFFTGRSGFDEARRLALLAK